MTMAEPDDFEADGYLVDDYECDGCTCCSQYTCHAGPSSQCPTNQHGEFICPCTEA